MSVTYMTGGWVCPYCWAFIPYNVAHICSINIPKPVKVCPKCPYCNKDINVGVEGRSNEV